MDTFGDKLRREREQRGFSIEAVSAVIGVDHGRLRALERNDFEALAGEADMIGCLRAYAECLGVDAALMIDDFVHEKESRAERPAPATPARTLEIAERPAAAGRSAMGRWLAASIALAAIVVLGAWWSGSEDAAAPSSAPSEPSAPVPASRTLRPASAVAPPVARERSSIPAPVEPRPIPVEAPIGRAAPPATPPLAMTPAVTGLSVPDHGVGTAVRAHELVGRGDRFAEGDRVWFWTRLEGGEAGDGIEHVWLREGVEVSRVALRLGGERWRTQSYKSLAAGAAGRWAVEARDAGGHVLARSEFTCTP
jgi:cytoskeletal protein RodZ